MEATNKLARAAKKIRKGDPCTAVFDCDPPADAQTQAVGFGGATITKRKNVIDIERRDGLRTAVCRLCGRCAALQEKGATQPNVGEQINAAVMANLRDL